MKNAYTIFKRKKNGVWYLQSTSNKAKQRSLGTKDEMEARQLLAAENNSVRDSAFNLELAKVYAKGADPMLAKRTWQEVMNALASRGKESSQARCKRAMQSKPFDHIRNKPLIETTPEDFKLF